jgi:hypothetical protein
MTAGRIARELWWLNQDFSTVDVIPPWFFMFMYHLGYEQQARWWPQFRDILSPHQHHHHQNLYIMNKILCLAAISFYGCCQAHEYMN